MYIKGECLLKDSDPSSVTVTVIRWSNLDRRLLFSLPADTAEEERKNGYSDCRDQLKGCKPSICVFSIKQYSNCIHCLHFNCHIRHIFTKSVLVDSSYFYSYVVNYMWLFLYMGLLLGKWMKYTFTGKRARCSIRTNTHTTMICMKACYTYRSCMKITLSHKEQQIFLAQCFWEGITDFEVLN